MKKLTLLVGAAILLTLGACSRKGLCPAYGAVKPVKPTAAQTA